MADPAPQDALHSVVPPAPAARPTVAAAPPAGDLWSRVSRSAAESSSLLRGLVPSCTLVRVRDGVAVIECAERFRAQAVRQAEKLAEVFTRELGTPTTVRVVDPDAPADRSNAAPPNREQTGDDSEIDVGAESDDAPSEAMTPGGAGTLGAARAARPDPVNVAEHPLVKQAVELFGARVVDVQPRRT